MSTSTIHVDRVIHWEPLPDPVAALDIERPVAGARWSGPSLELSGWVLGRTAPPSCVEVLHGGRVIRRLPVHVQRADLPPAQRALPDGEAAGFAGMVSTIGLPAELRLELVVAFTGGARARVAVIEARRTPLAPRFVPTLRPLLVVTLEDMVPPSALVALGVHPRIVGLRQPPYVADTAKYWLQALRLLAEPTMGPADEAGLRHVVREPSPGDGLYLDRVAELCQRNIDSWYLELGDHQLKRKARYFAERFTPGPLLAAARELYDDAREILLVRDPRQWLASAHRALAAQGRGGADGEPPEAWVRRQGGALAELQAHAEATGKEALLLRHEDLLLRPEPTVRALLRHLALDADDHAVSVLLGDMRVEIRATGEKPATAPREHGTWQDGLSPAVSAVIDEVTSAPLRAFGYAAVRSRTAVAGGVPLQLGKQ